MGADSITIIVSSSYTFDPLCIKGWMLRIKNGYNMNERYTYIYRTIGKRRQWINRNIQKVVQIYLRLSH